MCKKSRVILTSMAPILTVLFKTKKRSEFVKVLIDNMLVDRSVFLIRNASMLMSLRVTKCMQPLRNQLAAILTVILQDGRRKLRIFLLFLLYKLTFILNMMFATGSAKLVIHHSCELRWSWWEYLCLNRA